jgi:hypothetical protein
MNYKWKETAINIYKSTDILTGWSGDQLHAPQCFLTRWQYLSSSKISRPLCYVSVYCRIHNSQSQGSILSHLHSPILIYKAQTQPIWTKWPKDYFKQAKETQEFSLFWGRDAIWAHKFYLTLYFALQRALNLPLVYNMAATDIIFTVSIWINWNRKARFCVPHFFLCHLVQTVLQDYLT